MAKWSTANQFLTETLGKSYDMDRYPKNQPYQCWDYADYFWVNQVGRPLITKAGGNGSAKDCWNISRTTNAGKEFDLVTDKNKLKIGDWCIFGGGSNGHVGIVKSIVRTGQLVVLQGENQGSIKVNAINYSLGNFLGAFRYKAWNKATPTPKKSNEEIAKEVIAGKWGNGDDRKNRLTKAGYNYNTIQSLVNQMLSGNTSKHKSDLEIAREVIQGKWGNGTLRKTRLTLAGYNYNNIQAIVNNLLR